MNLKTFGTGAWPYLLLVAILTLYAYFFSFLHSGYLPYYGDEFFYFKNSESFVQSLSLKAAFTYSGSGARILGADAHGPAYPLIYGAASGLLGWGGLTIPLTNLAVLGLATFALFLRSDVDRQTKLLQCILILGSPMALFYSITYMPELLHLSGAVGLYLLSERYLRKQNQRDLLLLLAFIVLLGSIRSTWFFALIGLSFVTGTSQGYTKSTLLLAGLALPFLFQYFLHEQVPNTFSMLGSLTKEEGIWQAIDTLYRNAKRNVYLGLTYTEGYFYTVLKLWIAMSFCAALALHRKNHLLLFGTLVLGVVMAFTVVLYKNHSWIELRLYTPMTLFLNLALLSSGPRSVFPKVLLTLSLTSFVLLLPLQQKLVGLRTIPALEPIPDRLIQDIKSLSSPLIYVDEALLEDYAITTLPTLTDRGELIRYILPYYQMESESPSHRLALQMDHSNVKLVKILAQ